VRRKSIPEMAVALRRSLALITETTTQFGKRGEQKRVIYCYRSSRRDYRRPCIAPTVSSVVIVEAHPIEDRIKELCESAANADDSEVPTLFDELRAFACRALRDRQISSCPKR
jgi:hypothetical protein